MRWRYNLPSVITDGEREAYYMEKEGTGTSVGQINPCQYFQVTMD
jgi:hypothetical protein